MPAPPSSHAPFSRRLSPEERARLEREATGMSLGPIRWRVLNPDEDFPSGLFRDGLTAVLEQTRRINEWNSRQLAAALPVER